MSAATRRTARYAQRMEQGRRFIRIKEVRQRTGLGNTTIYKRMNEGTFPPNVSLGPRMSAWVESEVDAWISSQATTDRDPWTPPLPPPQKVGEKKLPPLVPHEKGAEAAAKIAGVVGLKVPEGDPPPPDVEIALRFPDWPKMMRQRTAAAYLDLSESAFIREVYRGTLPYPVTLGGRQSWSRQELDASIAKLLVRTQTR